MKVCPSCKEYKEGDEKFCTICGAKLLEKIICEGTDESESKCRKLLDPNDNFCAQCGQRVIKKPSKDSGNDRAKQRPADTARDDRDTDGSERQGNDRAKQRPADTARDDRDTDGSERQAVTPNVNKHTEPSADNTELEEDEVFQMANDNFPGDDCKIENVHILSDKNDEGVILQKEADKKTDIDLTSYVGFARDFGKELILVKFHALVSPDVICDEKYVYVKIEISEYDATQMKRHYMKPTLQVDEETNTDIILLTHSALLPRQTILQNGLTYRYLIYNIQKTEKGYTTYKQINSARMRTLNIPQEDHQIDIWCQFDGYLNTKETKLQKIVRKSSEMITNKDNVAERCARMFGQSIIDTMVGNAEDIIVTIRRTCKQLILGLKTAYGSGQKGDILSFNQKMHRSLWLGFENRIKTRLPDETDEQIKRRVLTLVSMLYLYKDYRISLEEGSKSLVCEKFLLRKKGGCVQEWNLLDSLSQSAKNDLCDAFLEFSFGVQDQLKNPQWLYFVPFVHFLNGQSTPFKKIPKDAGHDSEKPLWWGIKDKKLEDAINSFKKKERYAWPT